MSSIKEVLKFMKMAKQEVPEKPKPASETTAILRLSLILEELTELAQASGSESLKAYSKMLKKTSALIDNGSIATINEDGTTNMIEVLDALVDIRYVADGAVIAYGLQDVFHGAFANIQESNMSKACDTQDEALATIRKYAVEKGVKAFYAYEPELDKYLVLRTEDKKLLKSINYIAADMGQFLKD